jgi:Bacterial extracellular solute-binding protein
MRPNAHWERSDTADKVGVEALWWSHDRNVEIAGEDFLSEDSQLEIREPVTDATVDAGAVGKMLARLGAVDDEGIGIVDRSFVAVARNVPHHNFVALPNVLASKLGVTRCGTAHMNDRCLVADHYFARVLDRLGIAEQMKAKTILVPGAQAADVVAKGEAELGVAQASEIVAVAGAQLVGPLPGEYASMTVFTAGIGAGSKAPDAAKALIQFLTGPSAAPVIKSKGFEPG